MKKRYLFCLLLCLCCGCVSLPTSIDSLKNQLLQESSEDSSQEDSIPTLDEALDDLLGGSDSDVEIDDLEQAYSRLYDASSSLYTVGLSTAYSYSNPFFHLYYEVPANSYVSADAYIRQLHTYTGVGDGAAIEFLCTTEDNDTALLIFSESVAPELDAREYLLNEYSYDFLPSSESTITSVDVGGQEFLRYSPFGEKNVYYVRIENGIALNLQLLEVNSVPGSEEAWLSGFYDPSIPTSAYCAPFYTTDSYESRWLNLRFTLPLDMSWFFEDEDTEDLYYEIAAITSDSRLMVTLVSQTLPLEDSSLDPYLDLIESDLSSSPDYQSQRPEAPVQIAGSSWQSMICTLQMDEDTPVTLRYYVRIYQDRLLILWIQFFEDKAPQADALLEHFTPLDPAQLTYSDDEEYQPGILADGVYSNPVMGLTLSAPQMLAGSDAAEYFWTASSLENATLECLAMPALSASQAPSGSLLFFSEDAPDTSYRVHEYLRILQEREPQYDFEESPGLALLGGKLYITQDAWSQDSDSPLYRKYYFRFQGDQVFCILASTDADHITYINDLVESMNS